ncbi:MAG: hypothetical protein JJE51_05565 [Thermoanaerobaculia bacterium]|nr:hypothetical protein [Thermoanaerobaculia bacterium]
MALVDQVPQILEPLQLHLRTGAMLELAGTADEHFESGTLVGPSIRSVHSESMEGREQCRTAKIVQVSATVEVIDIDRNAIPVANRTPVRETDGPGGGLTV